MMNVNEIWCSICCIFMDEGCKKCSHFNEQVHMDKEDKVDTSPENLPDADKGTGMITGEDPKDKEKRMTNFDKLLEDPETREVIMKSVAEKFCIDANKMVVHWHTRCNSCLFNKDGNCDDLAFEWMHEEYEERKAGEG